MMKNSAQNAGPKYQYRLQDAEWIAMLSGQQGEEAQRQSYQYLANYLFVVLRNFIHNRQPEFTWLASLDSIEIDALVEDMTQVCLIKLNRNNHVLLEQFKGKGTFTAWAAQIALNEARSELRRVRWSRLLSLDDAARQIPGDRASPEQIVQQQELLATLERCLEQLSAKHRIVLVRCIMNGEKATDVARDLKRSVQAIYNLLNRAKKQLAILLAQAHIDYRDLALLVG